MDIEDQRDETLRAEQAPDPVFSLQRFCQAQDNLKIFPSIERSEVSQEEYAAYVQETLDDIAVVARGLDDERVSTISLDLLAARALDEYDERVEQASLAALREHKEMITKATFGFDLANSRAFAFRALRIKKALSPEQLNELASSITQEIEEVGKARQIWMVFSFVEEIFNLDFSDLKNRVLAAIRTEITEKGIPSHTLAWCFVSAHPELRKFAESQLHTVIQPYGIDPIICLELWRQSTSRGFLKVSEMLSDNLETMQTIEKQSPGICKFLYTEYKIIDYGRYPADMLLRQRAQHGRDDIPYGIIINPTRDHNGAFYQSKRALVELDEQIKNTHMLRAFEVSSKRDIVHVLHQLQKQYGGKQKIAFVLLGGHGSSSGLTLGGNGRGQRLEVSDFTDRRIRLDVLFDDFATIILESCSTGKAGGVGEAMSKLLDREVIAPDADSFIASIKVVVEQGRLIFEVEFGDSATAKVYGRKERVGGTR
jgi:hypothetical protein